LISSDIFYYYLNQIIYTLKSTLTYAPKDRISAQDCMKHSFFQKIRQQREQDATSSSSHTRSSSSSSSSSSNNSRSREDAELEGDETMVKKKAKNKQNKPPG